MKTYKFRARIEGGEDGERFIYFPNDVQQEFGTRGRVPIRATFDGVHYIGSLVRYSPPQHLVGIMQSIRKRIGKDIGGTIDVELWKDEVPEL